ncbi:MFS transporter [Natronobacterium gregoryi]|uniref:MFS transporter n=2 Tax=Natronobacterium gregoryi TaxID=44930 RepID=L0AKL8_NATGS|nr:MFS transporter [Natronobacterium gregoryi]AFZ74346.1 sugar phosphate permease [Natronobacterium gregoryi SP2]ELY63442.1 major facilitator superfamily protein [Natronobacterium gregoryi SP2]PLK22144.1 MFS transporter [Natronobacterium gregoryi SP2]SFI54176.1 Sugar phosphate permease [Natronobacterium gregoryi]
MSVTTVIRRTTELDVLLLTAGIWFLAKFIRYAFPPLFGLFQKSYGVSNAVLGTAFTGFMLVYALMQFPSGVLADRLGSVTVITAGVLVASIASLTLVVDSPFVVLVVAMLLMGAGTGAHKTVAVRLLSRAYPARTGRALGVFDTLGTFGGVVAPAAVVAVAGMTFALGESWRLVYLAAGIVGLGFSVAFWRRVPARVPDDETSGGATSLTVGIAELRRYTPLFFDWRFSVFALLTVLFAFTYNGLVAFAPLYLTDEAGLTETTAGLLYSGLFLASLVQLVTGELSDRLSQLPIIVATLGLATLSLVAFVSLTGSVGPVVLGSALVAAGIGAHGFRPVRGAYLMSVLPDEAAGGGLGVVRTLLMAAGAVAPAIVGVLSEHVGFRPTFWLLATSVGGATLLALGLLVARPQTRCATTVD